MAIKTIIEPFKIKSVEPIHWTTRAERERLLRRAHYNLFQVPAADILIDLTQHKAVDSISSWLKRL